MLSLEGKQLGNYDVIKRIRVGGMGAVYEGRQRTAFDRRVAIKVILGDYAADRDMRRRFAREARTIARLQHPHILPLIEFGDEQGILYLVMPFIDGGTLTSYLRRNLPDLDEVAALYAQLLDAVEYAHDEGLVHRDIKSSNVLLEMRRKGPPHVYLADFGLVRTMHPDAANQPGKPIPLDQVPGTPHYMAPEQTRGIVTTQSDIYALGVLLYQMLTGSLPYNDPDEIRVIQMHLHTPIPLPSQIDGSLPRELDAVVRRAMAKRASDRFETVAELRTAFFNALNGPIVESLDDDAILSSEMELSPPASIPSPPRTRRAEAMPPAASLRKIYEEETQEPPLQPRRLPRNEPIPAALREARLHARNTDSAQASPPARVTEEPRLLIRRRQRRRNLIVPLVILALITVLLLGLFLAPAVWGINILPAGLLPGTTKGATVMIQVQQKTESNTFVLTASSAVKTTDLDKRSIPARTLQVQASNSKTVMTTAQQTIDGAKATGTAIFTNPSGNVLVINPDAQFTANGVTFHLPTPITVPARQNNKDGQQTGTLEALTEGAAGNIAPHALDGNTCCNQTILVSNTAAFSGGKDPQSVKIVANADINGVQQALQKDLQNQVQQNLQKQLHTGEVMAGSPTYNTTSTPNVAVGQAADQVTVTVVVAGAVTVYNRTAAENAARNLLINQAKRDLGTDYKAYQLQGTITITSEPTPTRQTDGKDEPIFLNVSVRGVWRYAISNAQVDEWRTMIKSTSKSVATTYLKSQPGVASVEIQLPTGSDQLPADVGEIMIEMQTDK